MHRVCTSDVTPRAVHVQHTHAYERRCCLCTQARCERKQREEHEVQQQVTSTEKTPADSLAGGKPTEGEVSFKSTELESKLEGEIKQRASQASMPVPRGALSTP